MLEEPKIILETNNRNHPVPDHPTIGMFGTPQPPLG